ncbi:MAG: energy transducer TonB [Saprospiraceae bacterium]|nr:energy transducer TonB [Saprospiraceae bacterium]
MKKHTIFTLSLVACMALSLSSVTAQVLAQGPMVGELTVKKTTPTLPTTNEQEVLSDITKHIGKTIDDFSDLLAFYNTDVEFVLSFQISKSGKIEQITSSGSCKSPIAAALVKDLEDLGKVRPVVRDGVAIERQFRIPVRFEKS